MTDLSGKTALVTGGSRGIGRAIATRLAADGAIVAVHYGAGSGADAAETVSTIEENGGRAFAVAADLTAPEDATDALFEQLDRALEGEAGEPGLDILVNNAGMPMRPQAEDITREQFDAVQKINVHAPFWVTRSAIPRLRRDGRIVNVTSAAATTRNAFQPVVAYAMTKGALDAMTLTLAKRLGTRGITVNSVAPAFVETEDETALTAADVLGRVEQAEDVADIVGSLVSADGRRITGQVLDVADRALMGV